MYNIIVHTSNDGTYYVTSKGGTYSNNKHKAMVFPDKEKAQKMVDKKRGLGGFFVVEDWRFLVMIRSSISEMVEL